MITSVLRGAIVSTAAGAGAGGIAIARRSPLHRIHRRGAGGNPAGLARDSSEVLLSPRRAAGTNAAVPASGGRLHVDRDHHVHLGGAVPRSLVARWEGDGVLSVDDEIEDLVDIGGTGTITVRRALERYRSDVCSAGGDGEGEGESALLSAYQAPYPSLPVFLTMYRAYSRRNIIHSHAAEIARCIHPEADVRVSLREPGQFADSKDGRCVSGKTTERPEEYAVRALEEMKHFRDRLISPGQRLVLTVPRQTFTSEKNYDHFCSFVDLLSSSSIDRSGELPLEPLFDFAGRPVDVELELPLLQYIQSRFPAPSNDGGGTGGVATIFYHHGELLPPGSIDAVRLPLSKRVDDAFRLLPYVDRIGHAICLGVAIGDERRNPALAERARACLDEMAERGVGVEVCPSCNLSLGGATDLGYVRDFLDAGVDVFVGTDDPAFMGGTTLAKEARILLDSLNLDVQD